MKTVSGTAPAFAVRSTSINKISDASAPKIIPHCVSFKTKPRQITCALKMYQKERLTRLKHNMSGGNHILNGIESNNQQLIHKSRVKLRLWTVSQPLVGFQIDIEVQHIVQTTQVQKT